MGYTQNITNKQIIDVKANSGIAFDVVKGTLTVMTRSKYTDDFMLLGHYTQGSYSDMQDYDGQIQFLLQGNSQAILRGR